jgi:alpha-beta hydrolase superfamily lysophospholipase
MATAAKEEYLDGAGGPRIFVRSWQPAAPPKAVVVIVPGFNSHGGQYLWVADQLVSDGYAVYAVDLRGRGKSDGERFYVNDIGEYESDVDLAVKLAQSREPGAKIFMLGHSAGGVVACVYTLDHQPELAGLVCESFAFQVPAPDVAIAALKGLAHITPHVHVLKLKNEDFSRDPARVKFLNDDPLIANESQPAKTIAALAGADERLAREIPKITLPVFILHGTLDKATKPSGSQEFYDRAGSKDKSLKLYDGHFHDLLGDVGKEGVISDIKAWLNKRV